MTGDGVNDAPSLKQAEVGCAVSNATDAAKGSASVILLNEGLSGILAVVREGRRIHRRIVTWVLVKICKTLTNTAYIFVAYFVFGQYPALSVEMAIILLLTDFVTISVATDNVQAYPRPCHWNVHGLAEVGLVLAFLCGGLIFALLCAAVWWWDVPWQEQIYTLSLCTMYYVGNFITLLCRVDGHWWSLAPSATLAVALVCIQLLLVPVALLGVPIIDLGRAACAVVLCAVGRPLAGSAAGPGRSQDRRVRIFHASAHGRNLLGANQGRHVQGSGEGQPQSGHQRTCNDGMREREQWEELGYWS